MRWETRFKRRLFLQVKNDFCKNKNNTQFKELDNRSLYDYRL
jgi:hypothetical protein